MIKRKSLFEAVRALKSVVQTLLKKFPSLFLVFVYLIDLGIRNYLSIGWSKTYILGIIILIISLGIYINTKSFSETTLSFILGVLTIYSIDWDKADFKLFIILYLAYIVLTFYTSSISLAAKQENILMQASCKLDMENFKDVYNRIKRISEKNTKYSQLSIIEKSEVIRYLAFRQVMIGEYEEAINMVEVIKGVCQMDLIECCEIYYGLYTYCYNKKPTPSNISKAVERMFDKVTTLTISYIEFFEIFSKTKRILVDEILSYDEYILRIKLLALKGYSSSDIIDKLKEEKIV